MPVLTVDQESKLYALRATRDRLHVQLRALWDEKQEALQRCRTLEQRRGSLVVPVVGGGEKPIHAFSEAEIHSIDAELAELGRRLAFLERQYAEVESDWASAAQLVKSCERYIQRGQ